MKENKKVLKKLNLLLSNDRSGKLPKKVDSLVSYSKTLTSSKEDFYNFSSLRKFAYIKRSRLDKNGQEPIVPLTKNDYKRLISFEADRFLAMGVKKTDAISIVDFTINETIPMVASLIKIDATYVVTEGGVKDVCEDLRKKSVNVIFTHSRMLEEILSYLEMSNKKISMRLVMVTGEPASDEDNLKKRVRNLLGAKLVDTIGSREIGGYAYKCPHKDYYHFLDDLYIEVISPKTKKTVKSRGELVITPLWRRDLPLIRFATGDLVSLKKKKCSCIINNELVFNGIRGRVDDIFKLSYSMISLREVYLKAKYSLNYQYPVIDNFIWRTQSAIEVSVLLTKENNEDIASILIKKSQFNKYLRRRSVILNTISSIFNIGVQIVLVSDRDFESLEHRYLDSRYITPSKIPVGFKRIIDKYSLSLL